MHTTILTPAFNTSKYITSCLQSALSQTHKDFDILVIDDHSTDQTAQIVQQWIPTNPISLICLPEHKGVTYATHIGIKNAKGPIITILDSDDLLFPNSLETGIHPFEDPEVGFVWTKFQKSNGGEGWSHPLPEGKTLWQAMMYNNWWKASHQKFFRKSVYESGIQLNTEIDRSSDYQLVLLLALSGCKYKHIDKITYYYRVNRAGSLSSQGRQKAAVTQIKGWLHEQIKKKGINEPK